jgi:hypothetical protein
MIAGSSFGPYAGWSTKSIPAHTAGIAAADDIGVIGVHPADFSII